MLRDEVDDFSSLRDNDVSEGELMSVIYKLTIAHKYYYGQTGDPVLRARHHLSYLKSGKHVNPYMQACWDKYIDFGFEIVQEGIDPSEIDSVEQTYIDKFFDEPDCMNLNPVASKPPSQKGMAYRAKPIVATLPDGTTRTWPSATEAEKELNLSRGRISAWITGPSPYPDEGKQMRKAVAHMAGWRFAYV